jgi:hypothetical protein
MPETFDPILAAIAAAGVAAGMWLLGRGLTGYRTAARITDTSTSRISSLAAGEVRLSGVIEPAELTLVSPLQSAGCVYYRATIRGEDEVTEATAEFTEERAVGFKVRDASGAIRVFPRRARWDAPVMFDDRTGSLGDEPIGLSMRTGSAVSSPVMDHDTAVAALLSVRPALVGVSSPLTGLRASRGRRRYKEARLEVGDEVTIIGRALPFGDLDDPAEADIGLESDLAADDPIVMANIAEARAAGLLLADPKDAWGNAAIPGFGIGRPTREPSLDPLADRLMLADADEAARVDRTFSIEPEALVLASSPGVPLLIAYGAPQAAAARHNDRFVIGLLGAILAIGSALAFAVMLTGGFAR